MKGLMACFVLLLAALPAPALAEEWLELTGFQLIDGSGAVARPVQSMLVRDGRIVAIDGQGSRPAAGARWTRIDLAGTWVMPGLIDTHVHVSNFADPRKGERILRAALRGGVTAVRDLAGDTRSLGELERAIAVREWLGPDLVYSALFGGPDVFRNDPTSTMSPGRVPGQAPWGRQIDAGTDLRLAVAQARGTGAKNLKVYADLDARQVRAILREARAQGMQTTAHATVFPARPGDLVKAGVGSLAHAPYLIWEAVDTVPDDYSQRTKAPWDKVPADHPRLLALYRDMAERGVFLDATLYIYKSMKDFAPGRLETAWTDAALAWGAQATRLARAAGVRVTTGTDWFESRDEGGLPNTHAELALLVELAGFTPQQAIVAATRDGAAALGLDDQGSVEVGKLANLIVLDADPLADIHNTTRLRMTIKRGEPVAATGF
ncbi:imidazolonepropionase-like amidohydrolase [Tahibacter aquaticus]|uniref:Imidazolonepropionase-like amidohydrolase n=1 Tax=Tahibacter aquaticus TaxID=520092 RepID=A0A4R6YRT7_9GAMM|nr:amidohydrolase family protein [Tahibacter aquaticus]TDR40806.1 imidazolonepropionase-like amidohydrolase [Tahibacter aquaticus]